MSINTVNAAGNVELTVSQNSVFAAIRSVSNIADVKAVVSKTDRVAKGVISAAVEQVCERIKAETGVLPVVKEVSKVLYIPHTIYKLRNMLTAIDAGELDWIGAFHAFTDNSTVDKKNVCPAYSAAAMAISRLKKAEEKATKEAEEAELLRIAAAQQEQAQAIADKATGKESSAAVKGAAFSAALDGITAGNFAVDVEQAARQAAQQAFDTEQQAAQQAEQAEQQREAEQAELLTLRATVESLQRDLVAAQAAQVAAEQALQVLQQQAAEQAGSKKRGKVTAAEQAA